MTRRATARNPTHQRQHRSRWWTRNRESVRRRNALGDFTHFPFPELNYAFAPGGVVGAPGSAYDNQIADKTVSIISKTPAGADIPQERENTPREYIEFPAISEDGSHILMQVKGVDGPVHLYMRVNDAISYDITQGDARFIGMTRDGSSVSSIGTAADTGRHGSQPRHLPLGRGRRRRDADPPLGGNGSGNATSCGPSWPGSSGCGAIPLTTERGHPFGFASVPALDDYIAAKSGDVYFDHHITHPNGPESRTRGISMSIGTERCSLWLRSILEPRSTGCRSLRMALTPAS